MILELHIKNYALIDQLTLEFTAGLNVLTGETGSGKSIILGALGLVLGEKASVEYVRTGEEEALIEAVLDIGGYLELESHLAELELENEEETLIITRKIQRNGKSICRVNGRSVTLGALKEIGRYLIDVYGQHEYISLFKPEKQMDLLDRYGGTKISKLKKTVAAIHEQYQQESRYYQSLLAKETEKNYKEDLLAFQVDELEKAGLKPGEDEDLAQEEKILANGERIKELLSRAYLSLYQGEMGNKSILDGLYQVITNLNELRKLDPSYTTMEENLLSIRYDLEETARELAFKQEAVETDTYRLQEVQERRELLNTLRKKYNRDIPSLISYLEEIKIEMQLFADYQQELEKAQLKLRNLEQEYFTEALNLSQARKSVAEELERRITQELGDLGMKGTLFRVSFGEETERTKKIGAQGIDQIEFLFSPNLGEEARSLSTIASGGELSRVMLALKVILAKVDQIPSLIFDEIDTGIGGRTAQVVGEKLTLVSRERQIICVTHSPQIASMADGHFSISKQVKHERTRTVVEFLTSIHRIEELARMLSGTELTDLTRQHAREMLEMAQVFKKNLA